MISIADVSTEVEVERRSRHRTSRHTPPALHWSCWSPVSCLNLGVSRVPQRELPGCGWNSCHGTGTALLQFSEPCGLLVIPASHCPEVDSRWTTEYEILKFLYLLIYSCVFVLIFYKFIHVYLGFHWQSTPGQCDASIMQGHQEYNLDPCFRFENLIPSSDITALIRKNCHSWSLFVRHSEFNLVCLLSLGF